MQDNTAEMMPGLDRMLEVDSELYPEAIQKWNPYLAVALKDLLYVAACEMRRLWRENQKLRQALSTAVLNHPTELYNWDDDSLPNGPEGPSPSF